MVDTITDEELTEFCRVRVVCDDDKACHLEIDCESEQQRDAYAKALENEAILRVRPKKVLAEPDEQ